MFLVEQDVWGDIILNVVKFVEVNENLTEDEMM